MSRFYQTDFNPQKGEIYDVDFFQLEPCNECGSVKGTYEYVVDNVLIKHIEVMICNECGKELYPKNKKFKNYKKTKGEC